MTDANARENSGLEMPRKIDDGGNYRSARTIVRVAHKPRNTYAIKASVQQSIESIATETLTPARPREYEKRRVA